MTQDGPRWLSLRVRIEPRTIVIEHRDRRGAGLVAGEHPAAKRLYQQIVDRFPVVRVPADLDALFDSALQSRPQRGPGTVPFPIFVEFPREFSGLAWDIWLRELLAARSHRPGAADLMQVIRLNPARMQPRGALSLPLTILTADAASAEAVAGLQELPWYAGDDTVREHGLAIRHTTPESLRAALLDPVAVVDVLLSDARNAASLLDTVRRVPSAKRPRLMVELGQPPEHLAEPLAPAGEAQLLVPPMSPLRTREVVTDFLHGIIHDRPLHEAVKETERKHADLPSPLRLIANPASNHGLRLSDALGPVFDAIAALTVPQLGGLVSSLLRAGIQSGAADTLAAKLSQAAGQYIPSIKRAVDRGRGIEGMDFHRETTGLKPMADLQRELKAAEESTRQMAQDVSGALATPDERERLRLAQGRKVNIIMEQLAREMADQFGPLRPDDRLLPTIHYRVRVNIGARSPASMVVTDSPDFDPLLPKSKDSEGHKLEVVIYGKDFRVVGANSKPVFLPTFGTSDTASFEVVTPSRSGSARLRLALYHENHLVQSFVLNARIGEGAAPPAPPLGFALEYSRTAKFANMTALRARAISIGINASGSATHSLHVKTEAAAVEFSIAQKLLDDQIKRYRKLLEDATFVNGQARFSTYPDPGDPISPDFHVFTREFADFGRGLHRALMERKQLQPSLRVLARGTGKTIQLVRFDPNFVFPWPVVYDFDLPTSIMGEPLPDVCRGVTVDGNGASRPCGHGPDDRVYCINGFWGARHVLEELIGNSDDSNNAIDEIARTGRDRSIRLAIDEIEPHTKKMHETFAATMGSAYAEVDPSENLLDLLWADAERPAVLAVVGHLETTDIVGEPRGARIVLPGKKAWLRADDIIDRVGKRGWDQPPHSLILLMACESGLTELGTLTGFVAALSSAPAAAVVGTECVAFSRLLTRFVNDVTLALWHAGRLGKAVTDFRRDMLAAGNPLAFAFHAVGGADVHLSLGAKP